MFFPLVGNAQIITTAEWHVKEIFRDIPILATIAKCESGFKQFKAEGEVLRGIVNPDDIGIMQINRFYHEKDAIRMGHDIFTFEGNIGYARHLYETQGSRPWIHSSHCWKKYV